MFCSLLCRLRSRVALGIGIVVIMYCKFLMEYVYKKQENWMHKSDVFGMKFFICYESLTLWPFMLYPIDL